MSLSSFSFFIFFIVVIVGMLIIQLLLNTLPIAKDIQIFFLLCASYVFVGFSNWFFLCCIIMITFVTYVVSLVISRSNKHKRNKSFVLGIVLLVLFLGYFKYTSFFVNSFRFVAGFDPITNKIILPLGVSFYVFSAIAYLIDVYRGEYPAEKNIVIFALYIAFFPKLTAGPIVRGKEFFPQIQNYRGIKWEDFKFGIQIFVFGLFKKIVLADHLGVFVDDVFHAPTAFNTGTVILATISYSLQIYFDFSGYSDMAIGVSKIIGFDFNPNFNLPYIAQNASEFWKRWHISLSSWFQDYLYIPLGGSRKGTIRTYINLMLVMLISGLWHGAGWTFIVWGALHGITSCLNKVIGKNLKKLGYWVNVVITFIFVTLFWVVFRADSFSTAVKVWVGMFTPHSGINQPYTWSFFAIVCLIISTIVAAVYSKKKGYVNKDGITVINGYYPLMNLSHFFGQVVFFVFCGITIIMGYFGDTAFIYGAF